MHRQALITLCLTVLVTYIACQKREVSPTGSGKENVRPTASLNKRSQTKPEDAEKPSPTKEGNSGSKRISPTKSVSPTKGQVKSGKPTGEVKRTPTVKSNQNKVKPSEETRTPVKSNQNKVKPTEEKRTPVKNNQNEVEPTESIEREKTPTSSSSEPLIVFIGKGISICKQVYDAVYEQAKNRKAKETLIKEAAKENNEKENEKKIEEIEKVGKENEKEKIVKENETEKVGKGEKAQPSQPTKERVRREVKVAVPNRIMIKNIKIKDIEEKMFAYSNKKIFLKIGDMIDEQACQNIVLNSKEECQFKKIAITFQLSNSKQLHHATLVWFQQLLAPFDDKQNVITIDFPANDITTYASYKPKSLMIKYPSLPSDKCIAQVKDKRVKTMLDAWKCKSIGFEPMCFGTGVIAILPLAKRLPLPKPVPCQSKPRKNDIMSKPMHIAFYSRETEPSKLMLKTVCKGIKPSPFPFSYPTSITAIVFKPEIKQNKNCDKIFKYTNGQEISVFRFLKMNTIGNSGFEMKIKKNEMENIKMEFKFNKSDSWSTIKSNKGLLLPKEAVMKFEISDIRNKLSVQAVMKEISQNCTIRFVVKSCDGTSTLLNKCGKCAPEKSCCPNGGEKNRCGKCYGKTKEGKNIPNTCYCDIKASKDWKICPFSLCENKQCYKDCNGDPCGTAKLFCGNICVGGKTNNTMQGKNIQCIKSGMGNDVTVCAKTTFNGRFKLKDEKNSTCTLDVAKKISRKSQCFREPTRIKNKPHGIVCKQFSFNNNCVNGSYKVADSLGEIFNQIIEVQSQNASVEVIKVMPEKLNLMAKNVIRIMVKNLKMIGENKCCYVFNGRQRCNTAEVLKLSNSTRHAISCNVRTQRFTGKLSISVKDCYGNKIAMIKMGAYECKTPKPRSIKVDRLNRLQIVFNESVKLNPKYLKEIKQKSSLSLEMKGKRFHQSNGRFCIPRDLAGCSGMKVFTNMTTCQEIPLDNMTTCSNSIDYSKYCEVYKFKGERLFQTKWIVESLNGSVLYESVERKIKLSLLNKKFSGGFKVIKHSKNVANQTCVSEAMFNGSDVKVSIKMSTGKNNGIILRADSCIASKNAKCKFLISVYDENAFEEIKDVRFGKRMTIFSNQYRSDTKRLLKVKSVCKQKDGSQIESETKNIQLPPLKYGLKLNRGNTKPCISCDVGKYTIGYDVFPTRGFNVAYEITDCEGDCLPYERVRGNNRNTKGKITVKLNNDSCDNSYKFTVSAYLFNDVIKLKPVSKEFELTVGQCRPQARLVKPFENEKNKCAKYSIRNAKNVSVIPLQVEDFTNSSITESDIMLKKKYNRKGMVCTFCVPKSKMVDDMVYSLEMKAVDENGLDEITVHDMKTRSPPSCEVSTENGRYSSAIFDCIETNENVTESLVKRCSMHKGDIIIDMEESTSNNITLQGFNEQTIAGFNLKCDVKRENEPNSKTTYLKSFAPRAERQNMSEILEQVTASVENGDMAAIGNTLTLAVAMVMEPTTSSNNSDNNNCTSLTAEEESLLQNIKEGYNIKAILESSELPRSKLAQLVVGLIRKKCKDDVSSEFDEEIALILYSNKNENELDVELEENSTEENTTKRRRRRRDVDEANDEINISEDVELVEYSEIAPFIDAFSTILYPVGNNTETMTAFLTQLPKYERSLCQSADQNINENSVNKNNIYVICNQITFEGGEMGLNISNQDNNTQGGSIMFKERMRLNYSSWICTDSDDLLCDGFYLSVVRLSKYANNSGIATEPITSGLSSLEMTLLSDVFITHLVKPVTPYDMFEVNQASSYDLQVPIANFRLEKNVQCHQWNNNKWNTSLCQTSILNNVCTCTCQLFAPIAVFEIKEQIEIEIEIELIPTQGTSSPDDSNVTTQSGVKMLNMTTSTTTNWTSEVNTTITTTTMGPQTTRLPKENEISRNVQLSLTGDFDAFVNEYASLDTAVYTICMQVRDKLNVSSENFANCKCWAGSIVVSFDIIAEDKDIINSQMENIKSKVEEDSLNVVSSSGKLYVVDKESLVVEEETSKADEDDNLLMYCLVSVVVVVVALAAIIVVVVYLKFKQKKKVGPSPPASQLTLRTHSTMDVDTRSSVSRIQENDEEKVSSRQENDEEKVSSHNNPERSSSASIGEQKEMSSLPEVEQTQEDKQRMRNNIIM